MKDATTRKYSMLEKKMVNLHEIDSITILNSGFKFIHRREVKDPDYEKYKKEDSPHNPDVFPEYTEETFKLGLVLGGKKIIYWRRVRCHDNLCSLDYVKAGLERVPIIEVDPDFIGEGGLKVCNDVLSEEDIAKLDRYLAKFTNVELPGNQATLKLD